NAANSPDAVVRLLFDVQPLAFRRLARAGWRSSRVHAASDQHAYETVEGASSRDRVRPSLPRALQVFPGGNRRVLLPGRSLRGAECPACKPRGASEIVALVEFAPLRCCVNRGRPFSDPNWVTDTAKRLGLEWTIRPRGRPKKQS